MGFNLYTIHCECDTCQEHMISTKLFIDIKDAYACRFQWVLNTKMFPCDNRKCKGYALPIIYKFQGDKGWVKLDEAE
jgi:hypothetical protein